MTLPVVNLNEPFMQPPMGTPGMPPTTAMPMPDEMRVEQAQALLTQETRTPVPTMEPAPGFIVDLPAGYITKDGELVRTAEVRELDGYAEERLSRMDMQKNVATYVTELLLLGVVRIGDATPTRELLKGLLIGDRDALVFGVRSATYGNEVEFRLNCSVCDEESEIKVELDKDVETITLEDPLTRLFDVPLKNGSAKVKLLDGAAQEAFSEGLGKKTQAETNTIMLSYSVKEINGVPVRGNTDPVLRLSAADRNTIIDFVAEHQPGPQWNEIRVPCAVCGEEYPVSLGLPSLFRF